VISAPSGAGKTTLARRLIADVPGLRFSISATTRPPRDGEVDGVHYHFMDETEFARRIEAGDFAEHEEVYPGRFYGTLHSELADRHEPGTHAIVLDKDVMGAMSLKRMFEDRALTIYIAPPSLEVLEERLRRRGSESQEGLEARMARAAMEMTFAPHFDHVIVNNDIDRAAGEAAEIVREFLEGRRGEEGRRS
jgi:guanylate kinase